jgi:S1-C subfamily serine protease
MHVEEAAANATLRIECGSSAGSGFHFLRPNIVVTNYHVIASASSRVRKIRAITEKGEALSLKVVDFSPVDEHDYAILEADGDLPAKRAALLPNTTTSLERGVPLVFSGFPHGIPHLLVQSAAIAGVVEEGVFYLDGSVNGGNSGGPIVCRSDGKVVGIVTQRRFPGGQEMAELANRADQLRSYCQAMTQRASVVIAGVDFGSFAQMMAEAMLLIRRVLDANANTGIGIGYSIEFVAARCAHLGIAAA